MTDDAPVVLQAGCSLKASVGYVRGVIKLVLATTRFTTGESDRRRVEIVEDNRSTIGNQTRDTNESRTRSSEHSQNSGI